MSKILSLCKKDIVLSISILLACLSCLLIHPSAEYLDYIDFSTLSILLSFMLIIAGLRECGLFDMISSFFMQKISHLRLLALVLYLLCFFSSMLITNDVALITMVPLTISILMQQNMQKNLPRIIIFETIFANLGSAFTPFGNPQNLYLFHLMQSAETGEIWGFSDFIKQMFPLSFLSLVILFLSVFLIPKQSLQIVKSHLKIDTKKLAVWLFCYILAVATVVKFPPYYILLPIVLVVSLLYHPSHVKKADYNLLLTFVFLFIFIGNLGKIPAVSQFLKSVILGREFLVSALFSQVFSNVPTAVLVSGFTPNLADVLLGVNVGGLGTLIASMASLISYKFYAKTENARIGAYIGAFSIWNFSLFALFMLWYYLR